MFADPLIWLFFVYVMVDFYLKANNDVNCGGEMEMLKHDLKAVTGNVHDNLTEL